MARFKIMQTGNRVELSGPKTDLFYEVAGVNLPPLQDYGFAVWHLLPAAIAHGFDIEIDGPVDPAIIENAERVSLIWEMWVPGSFHAVRVRAGHAPQPTTETRRQELHLFSGGVDSTHMLMCRRHRERREYVLTVHGMDYDADDAERFARLVDRTAPLLEKLNYDRVTLRTNLTSLEGGYHSWAMSLAGCAFLFSDLFGRANVAAERTPEEDMAVHPWGLNYVTNRYTVGSRFGLHFLHDDVRRAEKIAAVAADPIATHGLSLCSRRQFRPLNCGTCRKCRRDKAMFRAAGAPIPDIFIDPVFDRNLINMMELTDRRQRISFIELYQFARANGTLSAVPGLEDRFVQEIVNGNPSEQARRPGKRKQQPPAGIPGDASSSALERTRDSAAP